MTRSLIGRLAAPVFAILASLTNTGLAPAHDSEVSSIGAHTSLYIFGPEIPFMFEIDGRALNFRWSDLRSYGDTAIGTLTEGAGEVIGVDGEYGSPMMPIRCRASLPTRSRLPARSSRSSLPTVSRSTTWWTWRRCRRFSTTSLPTRHFHLPVRAKGTLASVEYQLAGPLPNPEIRRQVAAGDSQAALTIGTQKYTAADVPVTMIGLRAPSHLNTILQVPYHIRFLADDRSILGHVIALEADQLTIE